jgi:hypothetical protein
MLEEIDFTRLLKLSLSVEEPQDLYVYPPSERSFVREILKDCADII